MVIHLHNVQIRLLCRIRVNQRQYEKSERTVTLYSVAGDVQVRYLKNKNCVHVSHMTISWCTCYIVHQLSNLCMITNRFGSVGDSVNLECVYSFSTHYLSGR